MSLTLGEKNWSLLTPTTSEVWGYLNLRVFLSISILIFNLFNHAKGFWNFMKLCLNIISIITGVLLLLICSLPYSIGTNH